MKRRSYTDVRNAQPIDTVRWVHRDTLKPNHYNPNSVPPPELELLAISIREDGWTQPIVVNPDMTIIDGFHRWTVSGQLEVYKLTGGMVPVVTITPLDMSSQMMATVRHNRARGIHGVLKMADIVERMLNSGVQVSEICRKLQMETEEVYRLANRKGIPRTALIKNAEWSESWVPK